MRPRRRVALSMPRLSAFSWKRLSVFDFLSQSKTREQAPPRSTMRRRPGDLREDGMAASQAQASVAIDQGTTSSRAITFRAGGSIGAVAPREIRQVDPDSGWAEHDPEANWRPPKTEARSVRK